MRPHSKRLRSRSSSVVISLGGRSDGEDDLLAVLVDRVEGVEELLLGPLLVGDELDVVDEQQVDAPVAARKSSIRPCWMLVMNSLVNFSLVA